MGSPVVGEKAMTMVSDDKIRLVALNMLEALIRAEDDDGSVIPLTLSDRIDVISILTTLLAEMNESIYHD